MSYEKPNGFKVKEKEFPDPPIISAASLMLLETFALQNHIFIGIFDADHSRYIFQTSNAIHKEAQGRITDLEAKIAGEFTPDEKKDIRLFVCGSCPVNAGQNRIKYLLQRIPLGFGAHAYPGIYLDSIRNVTHLVSGEGYWLRIKAGEKVYSWFSGQKKLLRHDIISDREKEVIQYWAEGYSFSKIEDKLFISVNTIKNHLKACRNRLLARDNISLVQLCLLSGALR